MSLQAGTRIHDKLLLVRKLGEGGMGSVWIADHLGLSTQVAVKFMSPDFAASAEARGRFTREATAAAQIKSPHVVQVFDHGVSDDGFPFIVMELLDGEDLSKRVERAGALSVTQTADVLSQVCKALARAHAHGIVHRDIKPENVFVMNTDDDEIFVKVLDFGIAKRFDDAAMNMTSTGAMVGTPYYMSPEQIMSSKGVDQRADLWSVAVVAYHCLTGALPFVAETVGALCVKINTAVFEPPSRLRPELAALDAWFQKALARDPSERFASAKELSDTFRRAAGGVSVSSGPWPASEATALPTAEITGALRSTGMDATITANRRGPGKGPLIAGAVAIAGLVIGAIALVRIGGSPSDGGQPVGSMERALEPPAAAVPPPEPAPSLADESPAPEPSISASAEAPELGKAPPERAGQTVPRRPSAPSQQPAKATQKKPEPKPGEKDYGF